MIDDMKLVYLAIPLVCLFAAIIAGLFGRQIGRAGAHTVTVAGVAAACALSVYVYLDVLAGNTDYLELRNRRPTQYRLKRVESRKQTFQEDLNQEIDNAETEAEERLEAAQERLNAKVEDIQNVETLDDVQRETLLRIAQREEQTRFELQQQ